MSMIDDLKRGPFFEVRMNDLSPGFIPDPREEDLRRLRAEVETWRTLAEDRGRHLDELMVSLAQVRAELEAFPSRLAEELKVHAERLNAEHDRS